MAVVLLLSLIPMSAAAEADNGDVYLATTGNDANAGTEQAPVKSLNKALELVNNGGVVHIVDSYIAPAGFVWENHGKDVTITGGKLDLSQSGEIYTMDNAQKAFYYQGDGVTADSTAEITFIMYGNDGVEPIALPFTLG